jgi:uncharacterized membrane protein
MCRSRGNTLGWEDQNDSGQDRSIDLNLSESFNKLWHIVTSVRRKRSLSAWGVPTLYASVALSAGLTLPRIENHIFGAHTAAMSVSDATAIYSSIASGMIALTGIVFSLVFVMVQFSATAYSPRLVFWIARAPVISHALGIFIATFLYALSALAGVDRSGSGKVPILSIGLVIVLLVASVCMFIALVEQIGRLQIGRMLVFTADQGRAAISTTYPISNKAPHSAQSTDFRTSICTQTLVHHGKPRCIQAVYIANLVNLAENCGGVIVFAVAVGDTVVELMPLLHVYGARQPIDERKLRNGIEVGADRTFEQDPKYAIRLLVDIAIRALSPAVNDPTTAVQALDQIEDLLLRLGQCTLEVGAYGDSSGKLRLSVPFPTWEDLVRLSLDEICACGATSTQVMRRMNALIADLLPCLPEKRRAALEYWDRRLKATIARSFPDEEGRAEALQQDRQGLGGVCHL